MDRLGAAIGGAAAGFAAAFLFALPFELVTNLQDQPATLTGGTVLLFMGVGATWGAIRGK